VVQEVEGMMSKSQMSGVEYPIASNQLRKRWRVVELGGGEMCLQYLAILGSGDEGLGEEGVCVGGRKEGLL